MTTYLCELSPRLPLGYRSKQGPLLGSHPQTLIHLFGVLLSRLDLGTFLLPGDDRTDEKPSQRVEGDGRDDVGCGEELPVLVMVAEHDGELERLVAPCGSDLEEDALEAH